MTFYSFVIANNCEVHFPPFGKREGGELFFSAPAASSGSSDPLSAGNPAIRGFGCEVVSLVGRCRSGGLHLTSFLCGWGLRRRAHEPRRGAVAVPVVVERKRRLCHPPRLRARACLRRRLRLPQRPLSKITVAYWTFVLFITDNTVILSNYL
jgi:hypothetical protein